MKRRQAVCNVLHICNYAALYRGNFIDSLEALENFDTDVNNVYLFPSRARKSPDTLEWINAMNRERVVAYIQAEHMWTNVILLAKILRKHKITHIVRHFSDIWIDVCVKLLFRGDRVIRFFHSRVTSSRTKIIHGLKCLLWKRNKLVGVSDAVANELKEIFPNFSVTTIVNAVHFERMNVVSELEQVEGLYMLIMGRNYEIKGVDLAIKACAQLKEKYDFVLRIVRGRNGDELEDLIIGLLGKMVDWIQILPPTNNIGTYYRACDIFLSPSRQEAFGYTNVEAAYCENSIVLTKVGGQGELELDGAYWVKSEDVNDLAEKLEQAILEVHQPRKIAQRAMLRESIQKKYSLASWSAQVIALLHDVE